MPHLLLRKVSTDLAPSQKRSSLFRCKRDSCRTPTPAPLSPSTSTLGAALSHSTLQTKHPASIHSTPINNTPSVSQHPRSNGAPHYCTPSSIRACDPDVKHTLDLYNVIVIVYLYFLLVFAFLGGFFSPWSELRLRWSLQGIFRWRWGDLFFPCYYLGCPLSPLYHSPCKKLLGLKYLQRKLRE